MKNTSFNITAPHIFSPISALSKGSNAHINTLRLNVHETLQINQTNLLTSNSTSIQGN